MYISKIKVSGFRSFVDEVIIDELNKVNIFVGKNAAGKTNVLEIFLLLRGLTENDLYKPAKHFISINQKNLSLNLEFILEEEERKKYIKDLFKESDLDLQSKHTINIMKSNFLKQITHKVTLSQEGGIEEEKVSTSNVIDGDLLVWHQYQETGKFVTAGSNLHKYCYNKGQIENLKILLEDRSSTSSNWQILANSKTSDILLNIIREFYKKIDWTPPFRRAESKMQIADHLRLDINCSNLTQVWNTIQNEDPERLVQIQNELKKIIPEIASIKAPTRGGESQALIREPTGNDFDLSNTSCGLSQAAILTTKIMTCPNGTISLIEEPELHLHASVQRELRQQIEKYPDVIQFFITTHSTIIANANSKCNVYLVTKKDGQSYIKRVKESDEFKFIKWELGHSNTDLYGYNLVAFIEGDSEEIAFPIIADSLGYDLVQEGIKLINVKGKDNAIKIEQYLKYLKDSDTIPFIIMDGDKKVKQKIVSWKTDGLLPEDNHKMWDMEFEDLFSLNLIAECCAEMGYKGINVKKLAEIKGNSSVIHAIKRILHDSNQKELDKPELAVKLAYRICSEKQSQNLIKEVIEKLVRLSNIKASLS